MSDNFVIGVVVAIIALAAIVYMICDLIITHEHTKTIEALESTIYELTEQNQKQLAIHKRDMELIKYELRNQNNCRKVGDSDGKH